MIAVKMKTLMLKDNMICIQISERDFAQRLNFSCKQQNFFIYINEVTIVYVHDMQSEEFLIETFFSNFARMLQLVIIAQLSLIADFLNLKDDQSLILNDDNNEA
jgi:hypothetical protein